MAAFVPPGVVTTTLTAPAVFAGVCAVIEVALATTTFVAAVPPKVTPVAPVKLVPVIVTLVPPAGRPPLGLTPVTVGAAYTVYERLFAFTVMPIDGLYAVSVTVPAAVGVIGNVCAVDELVNVRDLVVFSPPPEIVIVTVSFAVKFGV